MIKLTAYEKTALEGMTFIDLFAGIGAFRLALESFGAACVFSSEWDTDAQNTYNANYNEIPAGDITQIKEEDVPKHDILCAGFPCQPFSISGKQRGFDDTRGTLFFDVARIVKFHKPKVVMLENVKNFASHDNGKTLQVITNTMDELGYDVNYKVLNATHYGVPQKRERIYILCFRKDLKVKYQYPEPVKLTTHLCDLLLPDDETADFVVNRDDIKWTKPEPQETADTAVRIGTVNKGGQGERIYSPQGVAITLSAYGGGVGAKTGLYLVNGKVRRLAPRECARVSGFPDTFKLPEKKNVAYKQFGNSIVVDVLQHLIRRMVENAPDIAK